MGMKITVRGASESFNGRYDLINQNYRGRAWWAHRNYRRIQIFWSATYKRWIIFDRTSISRGCAGDVISRSAQQERGCLPMQSGRPESLFKHREPSGLGHSVGKKSPISKHRVTGLAQNMGSTSTGNGMWRSWWTSMNCVRGSPSMKLTSTPSRRQAAPRFGCTVMVSCNARIDKRNVSRVIEEFRMPSFSTIYFSTSHYKGHYIVD